MLSKLILPYFYIALFSTIVPYQKMDVMVNRDFFFLLQTDKGKRGKQSSNVSTCMVRLSIYFTILNVRLSKAQYIL